MNKAISLLFLACSYWFDIRLFNFDSFISYVRMVCVNRPFWHVDVHLFVRSISYVRPYIPVLIHHATESINLLMIGWCLNACDGSSHPFFPEPLLYFMSALHAASWIIKWVEYYLLFIWQQLCFCSCMHAAQRITMRILSILYYKKVHINVFNITSNNSFSFRSLTGINNCAPSWPTTSVICIFFYIINFYLICFSGFHSFVNCVSIRLARIWQMIRTGRPPIKSGSSWAGMHARTHAVIASKYKYVCHLCGRLFKRSYNWPRQKMVIRQASLLQAATVAVSAI